MYKKQTKFFWLSLDNSKHDKNCFEIRLGFHPFLVKINVHMLLEIPPRNRVEEIIIWSPAEFVHLLT